jgi:hypothetical protein
MPQLFFHGRPFASPPEPESALHQEEEDQSIDIHCVRRFGYSREEPCKPIGARRERPFKVPPSCLFPQGPHCPAKYAFKKVKVGDIFIVKRRVIFGPASTTFNSTSCATENPSCANFNTSAFYK